MFNIKNSTFTNPSYAFSLFTFDVKILSSYSINFLVQKNLNKINPIKTNQNNLLNQIQQFSKIVEV